MTERIQELTAELDDTPPARRAELHRQLAGYCWELVYNGLVQGAVRAHWLQSARQHVDAALAQHGSADLCLLAVRIALEQGDDGAATEALQRAEQIGVALAG